MARKKPITIITCNGIDGTCAAAMALLKHPDAELVISSASTIGYTLLMLGRAARTPPEIHICGIGVGCEWDELQEACESLKSKKTRVCWHCGRGYLDSLKDQVAELCEPVFIKAKSNTEAVWTYFGLKGVPRARFLLQLALHDTALGLTHEKPTEDEEFWCDFLTGSGLQYFKFMDLTAYSEAIRKLATGEKDERARRITEIFRKSGAKYVLVGRSRVLSQLKERVRKCAETDEHVLILGESGVGKEWVAHLIHERSTRATEAFVPINCATFTGSLELANSELFGHRKGAFTGATEDRRGKLISADGGILFLDELGELPVEVQAKLLRVLEDGEVMPVGADRPAAKVDVRVVAATSRDLPAMVREGRFRNDLFHRLNVLRIHVPPLREHPHDIREIAHKTLAELPPEYRRRRLRRDDLRLLREFDWPGNVRQLIRVLKEWAYMGAPLSEVLEEERRFGLSVPPGEGLAEGLLPNSREDIRLLLEVRRKYALRALELHDGNLTATAKSLGVAINTLKKLLAEA